MSNKQILTADMISKMIEDKCVTGKKRGGWILFVLAALLFIACIVTEAGFACVLAIVFIFIGIRLNKASNRNKTNWQAGNYKVVKTLCTGYTDESDGEWSGYATRFENGEFIYETSPLGEQGDVFYLVYVDGIKQAVEIFNGRDYLPSDDLVVEEYSPSHPAN